MGNFLRQLFKRLTTSKSKPNPFLRPPQLTYLEERITPSNSPIIVTTTLLSVAGSLDAAIAQANATAGDDTIVFASSLFTNGPATISLTGVLPAIAIATSAGTLTITGPGSSSLTISGDNGVSGRNFRIFNIASGGNLSISGVTVSGAKFTSSGSSGGAFNNSGTLTVSNSIISGNTATNNGGGIYNLGSLTVSNSTISGNTAGSFGGGIYNRGTLTVSNSIISGNTSTYGGGGIRNGGIATVSNSTLSGNNSSFGGGIYNRDEGGNLTVINTTLSGNSATNSGGGIFNSGTAAVSNTTLSGNTATSLGGGLYNIGTGTLTNSTLFGNSASFAGGGIRNQLNNLTVINTTISGNSATNSGGGISNYSILNISNTIIANSTSGLDYAGSSTANVTSSNNLITSGTLSGSTTVSSSALNLGPLQNNGGPTLTMALGAGSPAIKTAAGTGTDQRGINRTTNDIGAYSFGIQVINTAPSGTGSLDAAITQANTTPGNDQISFNLTGSSPYTITLAGALPTILDATATASGTGGTGTTVGTVTITGLGASLLTIDGSLGGFSIFNIASGGNLSISGVTVSGANISSGNGGGFNNSGTLNIANSTISGNTVGDFGGGIFNNGALTVTNSTFSGNRANFGGGVFNNSNSTSNISNSTFSGNSAVTLGGGIFNQITNGIVTLTNSTLSGNSARSNANSVISSGGIYNDGTLNIANTIIANSTVINSSSPINDYAGTGTVNRISPSTAANNIVTLDTNTNTLTNTSSWATVVTSAALKLGPLQNNGGPTFTMALLNGSAAIGAGNSTISNASPINGKDQRGINRTTSDIGSYSFGIQVINTSDVNTVGSGSLRAAINLANTTPGNDQITFNLTGSSSYTITLAGALPNIIDATATASGTGGTGTTVGTLTITGLGASALTISGDNGDSGRNFRIFNIASLGNLAISGVTVIGANFTGNGGAFNNIGTLTITNSTISSNSATQQGGGILNFGTLAVSNSTLSGNIAQHGGGFYNSGIATFTNSTISGNSANTGGGAGNIGTLTISNSTLSNNSALNLGGALFNGLTGNLTVSNSTLSGNSASGNGGGGIYNLSTATVTNSTLSGNSAPAGNGGGIFNYSGSINTATLNLANTIIANSTSGLDYAGTGTIGTNANNLVEDGTLPGTSEITGDPKLGLLQNNGGPNFTMALGAGSAAIGATPLVTPNLDQRGFTRFNSDIGSYAYIAPTVQNDVVVAVNTSGQVGLFLSSAGTEITDFHTAFAGSTLTITAATIGTLLTAPSAGIAGITINNVSTANTITLDLNTLVNFAGLVIVGNSGLDSVTIGTGGVDLSAVTTGAANQSFTANILGTSTSTSALVLTNAIKTKATARTYLSAGSINGSGLITTPSITLAASTGIGNTTALNLAAASIAANSTAGAIDINNTSGISVSVTSLTTSGSAAITLDQTGAGGIGVDGPVTTGTGAITITSQQGILGSGVITQAAGAGGVTFNAGAGVITLTNASNNFTGSVSLNNSGANNVSITDTNAIDFGASTLGSGAFTVNAVGITQSGAITQAANAGAASFNAGAGVITLINLGNNFIGPVSLTNTGAFNVAITDTNDITIGVTNLGTGTFEVTGSTINLNNNITTTNNSQTYTGNVVVNANSGGLPLTLSAGSGAININGNINSAATTNHSLTVNATGDVILGGTIGAIQALGALLITGNDISLGNIGGANNAGTNSNVSVRASDGADNGSITLTGTIYNTTGQQFYNSSMNAGNFDGTRPITLLGGSAPTTISLTTAGASSNNAAEFTGLLDLNGRNLSINTTNNNVTTGGDITFNQTVNGVGTLALNAGSTGIITASGTIGATTPLTGVTITNAASGSFTGSIRTGNLTITDTTDAGIVNFQGDLTVNIGMTVAANGDYNVQMIGESNTIAGVTTFGNSGSLTFGDGGTDTFNFTGGIIATAPSAINLIGTVTAAGAGIITLGDSGTPLNVKSGSGSIGGTSTGTITLGNAILEDGVTLTVGTGIANVINMAAVTGTASAPSSNLIINTTGAVTVAGVVGTDIGNLTITNSGGTTFQSTVAAATTTITNTTGTVAFQGNLNLTTSLVTATQGYNVSITGTSNSIAGATTFLNTGTVTINNASGPSGDTTTFTGGLVITAPSSIAIQGTVRTTDTTMTLGDANTGVTLSANTTLNAGSGIINLDGVVSGASLTPITSSPGSTTISRANTNTTTNVTTGVVQISNTQSTNYVVSGGTLKGTGSIGNLTATGTGIIAPGNSAGKITTTSLDLSSGNTLQIEINNVSSPVAGNDYDQIVVSSSGTVNLGGATLSLSTSFKGNQGTVFTIIDNQGNSSISTTFNGLAEGAFIQADGRAYQISYRGGTGSNDVTLTVYDPATVTSFSPTIGKTGTSVVITGSNFTNVSQVSFNGTVQPTYTVNPPTQITTTVPSGATTGTISITTIAGTVTSTSSFTVDNTAPTLSIGASPGSLKANQTSTITFTFSEVVTGFSSSLITVTNGTITNPVASSSTVYTATFTPTLGIKADGTIAVSNNYFDLAGNQGTAATLTPPIAINTIQTPLVTGSASTTQGGSSVVSLVDPDTGAIIGSAAPFPGFTGEIRVVSGDFNNDGKVDIIAAAGPGGGPAVSILDSQTGEVMESFFAFDPAFTGGVFIAVRDTNGDGILDIIAGAGPSGGPEVRIFNGDGLTVIKSFFAYAEDFTGGVSVASVDFNNDGILDLVTGAGPGGAAHVKVFDGATNAIISQWYAYPVSFTGGVYVAAGDIGNDGNIEVVTGAGQGGAPVVAVWDPFTGALLAQFMAYAEDFTGGVRVGVSDGNSDGILDLITGAGPGGGPQVNGFSFPTLDLLFSFFSGDPSNTSGVFVS